MQNKLKHSGLILIVVIFLSIFIYVVKNNFFLDNTSEGNNTNIKSISEIGEYSDILNEENYKKIGINPNKYDKFVDFLKELKTFSGVLVDPENENFVIGKESENGSITYIPFTQDTLSVFDDKTYKNLAILDIFDSYKKGKLYGGANSKVGNKIIFEKDVMHPETSYLREIFGRSVNVNTTINELEKITNLGTSKNELLAYLYDFTGNYGSGINSRANICKQNKIFCDRYVEVTFSGTITDNDKKPISGALITLLNDTKINAISDKNGNYTLKFSWYSFSHLRFKSSKIGYSDGFNTISLNTYLDENWYNNYEINFALNKANNNIVLNTDNLGEYSKGGFYVFKTTQSTYFVPKNGLYYLDGKSYSEDYVSVYLYEFNKWSVLDNLLANDTFEPVYGYVGNLMKTFGMPYIQFFDKSGKELFIHSSNPILLQNQIYHMKELYENYDKIYEALTNDDMKFLVEKSKELGGYPIDFDFLVKNNFLKWPAWWNLDRKTGIWSNVGHRVLNEGGLVELPFYSIKDN